MWRTYPADTISRKSAQALYVALLGLCVMVVCAVYGEANKDIFLCLDGFGAIAITGLIAIWNILYIRRTYRRSCGNVLEVKYGKVVACHTGPFVYKIKDLIGYLVPIDLKPIAVTRTIRIPVYGNILSCMVECVAVIDNYQTYYDTFLETKLKDVTVPRVVMGAGITAFLYQYRAQLVIMQQNSKVLDRCDENVLAKIKLDAELYLNDGMRDFGLTVCSITPTYELGPLIIE